MRCLLSVRFNMEATVLNHYASTTDGQPVEEEIVSGHWEIIQDPDTGSITRIWVEDVAVPPSVNPGRDWTVNVNRFDIDCVVSGFPEVGFRSSANTESFLDGKYLPAEMVKMVYPAKYVLNRRQLITNIRGRNKQLLWMEEETGEPTVFEVQGVTPSFDPFGRHIDNLAVLKRSAIQ